MYVKKCIGRISYFNKIQLVILILFLGKCENVKNVDGKLNLKESYSEVKLENKNSCWDKNSTIKYDNKNNYVYSEELSVDLNGNVVNIQNFKKGNSNNFYDRILDSSIEFKYDELQIKYSPSDIFKIKNINRDNFNCMPVVGNKIYYALYTTGAYNTNNNNFNNNTFLQVVKTYHYKDGNLEYENVYNINQNKNNLKVDIDPYVEKILKAVTYNYDFDKKGNIINKSVIDRTKSSNIKYTSTTTTYGNKDEINTYDEVTYNSNKYGFKKEEKGIYEYNKNLYVSTLSVDYEISNSFSNSMDLNNLLKVSDNTNNFVQIEKNDINLFTNNIDFNFINNFFENINGAKANSNPNYKNSTFTAYIYNDKNLVTKSYTENGDYILYNYDESDLLKKFTYYKNNTENGSIIFEYDSNSKINKSIIYDQNRIVIEYFIYTYKKR